MRHSGPTRNLKDWLAAGPSIVSHPRMSEPKLKKPLSSHRWVLSYLMQEKLIFLPSLAALFFTAILAQATVIDVVQIYQPLSLHGSDVDDEVDDMGETLQAAVLSRPMALTGAFPETLVESISMPHALPTNNPNYQIKEVNLVVLCGIKVSATLDDTDVLQVEINIANLVIPDGVDLTARQVLKLVSASVRKTLTEYNSEQKDEIKVLQRIVGTNENNSSLQDLGCKYEVIGKGE